MQKIVVTWSNVGSVCIIQFCLKGHVMATARHTQSKNRKNEPRTVYDTVYSVLGTAVERRSLAIELSLSCARPVADGDR